MLAAATLAPAGCRKNERAAARSVPAVAFDRDVLSLKLAYGTNAAARIPVVGPRAGAAKLNPRPAPHAAVTAHVLADAINVNIKAEGTGDGLPVGTHVGNLVVETGLPEVPTLTLPYSIRVTGTLDVSPTNPYFNLRDPGGRARTITVRSTAQNPAALEVTAAEVASGPFAATVEKKGPGIFLVHVSVRAADVPGDDRGVLGRLVIRSNDPAEPNKEIPLLGLGKLSDGDGPSP